MLRTRLLVLHSQATQVWDTYFCRIKVLEGIFDFHCSIFDNFILALDFDRFNLAFLMFFHLNFLIPPNLFSINNSITLVPNCILINILVLYIRGFEIQLLFQFIEWFCYLNFQYFLISLNGYWYFDESSENILIDELFWDKLHKFLLIILWKFNLFLHCLYIYLCNRHLMAYLYLNHSWILSTFIHLRRKTKKWLISISKNNINL